MKRKIAVLFLGLGAIGGFACGFHSLRLGPESRSSRRDAFERHVATICTEAALAAKQHP